MFELFFNNMNLRFFVLKSFLFMMKISSHFTTLCALLFPPPSKPTIITTTLPLTRIPRHNRATNLWIKGTAHRNMPIPLRLIVQLPH